MKRSICSKCGHLFDYGTVRDCPHPAVNKVYGDRMCFYRCSGCSFKTKERHTGAIGCGYGKTAKDDGKRKGENQCQVKM